MSKIVRFFHPFFFFTQNDLPGENSTVWPCTALRWDTEHSKKKKGGQTVRSREWWANSSLLGEGRLWTALCLLTLLRPSRPVLTHGLCLVFPSKARRKESCGIFTPAVCSWECLAVISPVCSSTAPENAVWRSQVCVLSCQFPLVNSCVWTRGSFWHISCPNCTERIMLNSPHGYYRHWNSTGGGFTKNNAS